MKTWKLPDDAKAEERPAEARGGEETHDGLFGLFAPGRLYSSHSYFGSCVHPLPGQPLRAGGCVTLNSCSQKHTHSPVFS